MECMKDFVGVKSCSYAPSLSGTYINSLAGIEFANIDQIANADQVTWAGVWADVQQRAILAFREDVNNEFQKRYILRRITQTVDLGKQIDTTQLLTPVAGTQYGIAIETTENFQNNIACSNLQSIYLQSVNFYFYDNVLYPSITVTVLDADTTTQLFVTTVSGVQGWNNIWIDQTFANSRRILVLISGNFSHYVKLDISQFNLNNFGGWSTASGMTWGSGWNASSWLTFNWGGGCGCQARINGVQWTGNPLVSNFVQNTFGLNTVFSIKCGWDNIVCNNKRHFLGAWTLCLAKELLDEMAFSSRINRWTTTDKKNIPELKELYEKQYHGFFNPETNETMAGKLEQAIRGIKVNDFDCCFEANDHFISIEAKL